MILCKYEQYQLRKHYYERTEENNVYRQEKFHSTYK